MSFIAKIPNYSDRLAIATMSNLEGNNKEEKRREGGDEMPEGEGEGEKNKEGAEKMDLQCDYD